MNHAQIRAFHAVATEGGFTRAARALNVSQPAVTIQVKALEERYGVSLLERRGQRVALTELGRRLFAVTERLFGLEDEAEALLGAAQELRVGHLRVGADGPFFVMELLAAFIARYPGVRVSVTMGNTRAVLRGLRELDTDVAVVAQAGDDKRFHQVPLAVQPIVAFVARGHEWAGRDGVSIAELDGRPMVLREVGSSTREIFETALERAGVAPRVVMEVGSREAVREAVAAGLGIGVITEAELGSDDRLVALAVRDAALEARESVVCLEARRNLRPVQAFLELVAERPRAQP